MNALSMVVHVSPATTVWYCVHPFVIVPTATLLGGAFGSAAPNWDRGTRGKTQYAKPRTIFVHCELTPGFKRVNWVGVRLKFDSIEPQLSPGTTV